MWISVKEARAKVDNAVSLQTVYRIAHSGEVKATRLRGKIVVDDVSFAAYMVREGLRMLAAGAPARAGRVQAGRVLNERHGEGA